jgi:hypothetical protein
MRKNDLKRNIVDFNGVDLTRINHILDLNDKKNGVDTLVKVSIEIVDKMSYSEDFESLTGLKR